MTIHRLHSLVSHVDGSSATVVPDLLSGGEALEFDIDREVTANEFFPSHASVTEARASRTLECYALKTLLDLVGVTGLPIISLTNPGVQFFLQAFDDLGQPLAGSVHRSITAKVGWLIPQTISVDHRGHARLTVTAVIIKGTNDAVVIADNVALPTITISPARWTLGPVTIAGYVLNRYRNFEVDFGLTVTPGGVESNIWDTHIEVRSGAPSFTVRGIDTDWFSATGIPLAGKAATHANTSVILRKRDGSGAGAGFIDPGVAEHINITMAGPATVRDAADMTAQQPSEHSIVVEGIRDAAGNAPFILDTAATY